MSAGTVYLLGGGNHALVTGVSCCPINGYDLPFFGVCDNAKLIEVIGEGDDHRHFDDEDGVNKMMGVCREHGTLIFFQNIVAANYAMQSLFKTLAELSSQGWTGSETPTVN